VVLVANLIGIDRKTRHVRLFVKQLQSARVQPGRLAISKRVVKVEPRLHSLEQRQSFEITDRHAVLEIHPAMIRAYGKPPLFRNAAKVEVDAPPEIGVEKAI